MGVTAAVTYRDIVEALGAVGVERGEIVLVHSRLFTIGLVREASSPSETPPLYLRAFREVLGDAGTLVVPTYTTSFGRTGTPFVHETSPSEMGAFSECVRTTPGSRRTLHPIQSLAALGAAAEALTRDHPRWNVGHDTMWDRLLRRGARVVTLGVPFRQCLSFVHHAEFLACVPYLYHKVLRGEIYAGGARVAQDFCIAVRYLRRNIAYDLSRVDADVRAVSAVRETPLGADWVQSLLLPRVFEICMEGLRRDPYYLLRQPPSFVDGEIPCDGITSGREEPVPSYYQVAR